MKLLLYPHGGSTNHGCEAIVRSTVDLTGAKAVLMSSDPTADMTYGLDGVCEIRPDHKKPEKYSSSYMASWLKVHLLKKRDASDATFFAPVFAAAKECDLALSIGGDNYCYGEQRFLYLIDKELRRRAVRTILWGCSIEPDSLKGDLLEDLRGFDRIIARESLTLNALKEKGLDRVELCPDPAFALKRVPTILPEGFEEGNTVGINVSPLSLSFSDSRYKTMRAFSVLIQTILDKTPMKVILIPHVVRYNDDDRNPLGELYSEFQNTGRVVMVSDRPAGELKDIIARCRFMVAARTHATIAAYSCGVPTLAVGYSVKSKGIATDLFGTDKDYVVPVQTLDEDGLSELFFKMMLAEDKIRNHYLQALPGYLNGLVCLKDIISEAH